MPEAFAGSVRRFHASPLAVTVSGLIFAGRGRWRVSLPGPGRWSAETTGSEPLWHRDAMREHGTGIGALPYQEACRFPRWESTGHIMAACSMCCRRAQSGVAVLGLVWGLSLRGCTTGRDIT